MIAKTVNDEVKAVEELSGKTVNFFKRPKVKEFLHNHWVGMISIVLILFVVQMLMPIKNDFRPGAEIIASSNEYATELLTEHTKQTNVMFGLLMRSSLIELRDTFMTKGYATQAEKETYLELYEQYKLFGFNHLQDEYMEEVLKLPESR